MELDGRVMIITRGASEIGLALAKGCLEQGANVVIADTNEKELADKAAKIGANAVVADITAKEDIKRLVEKITRRFGKIDIFVSTASLAGISDNMVSENDWNRCWQADVKSQMYAAKYVLPQMINRRNGYLVNMVPAEGLLSEFRSEMYSTLKHPSLSFAERMAEIYGNTGIKVSVVCADNLITPSGNSLTTYLCDSMKLQNLASLVVKGIQQEQFMILTHQEKTIPFRVELYDDRHKRLRA